jgi:hypothetical protein
MRVCLELLTTFNTAVMNRQLTFQERRQAFAAWRSRLVDMHEDDSASAVVAATALALLHCCHNQAATAAPPASSCKNRLPPSCCHNAAAITIVALPLPNCWLSNATIYHYDATC